jgi:hypothetical protein
LRVHDRRFAFRTQHVRSVRQASKIKLLKIHRHSSQAVSLPVRASFIII